MGRKFFFILPVVVFVLFACEAGQQPWNPVK